MFVFMDESGDATIPGKELYFSLAAVAFRSEEERDVMDNAILELRKGWTGKKLKDNEFKFGSLDHAGKTQFFVNVGDLQFRHSSCVFWKENAKGQWKQRHYVYERVIRAVVNGLGPHFKGVEASQDKPLRAQVFYDQNQDPRFAGILEEEFDKLHSKDGRKTVNKLKAWKSKASHLEALTK